VPNTNTDGRTHLINKIPHRIIQLQEISFNLLVKISQDLSRKSPSFTIGGTDKTAIIIQSGLERCGFIPNT